MDTSNIYKMTPSYGRQGAKNIENKKLYLFTKINAEKTAKGAMVTYSTATSKDKFRSLYKAERVVETSFSMSIETSNPSVDVRKILLLWGCGHKLCLQVFAGC